MDSASYQLTGKIIMVIAIVVVFFIAAFILFLHLYAKWFHQQPSTTTSLPRRRRRGLDFAESAAATILRRGLDPSVLKSLPILIFDPKDFKDGLECAVCLSELADGDKTRLLPKCNHGFHVDCIDMWFQSHSTCPLCRNPVSNQSQELLTIEDGLNSESYSTETPNFPTNVLFWGNETQVSTLVGPCLEENNNSTAALETVSPNPCSSSSSSSSSITSGREEGMLVIDIPRQVVEEEEIKSPVITRLRSFKRLLSRDRRFNPFSASVDSEQANRAQVEE